MNDRNFTSVQYVFDEVELYDTAIALSQNKKKNKIPITDVAISKVPYVMYPDTTVNQSLAIHELAEHVLFLSKEHNKSNEVAITCDLQKIGDLRESTDELYRNIGITYGDEYSVEIMSDSESLSILNRANSVTVMCVHNHPSCNSFSIDDIREFLNLGMVKLFVMVTNKGELFYLSKGENYDRINYLREIRRICEKEAPQACDDTKFHMEQLSFEQLRSIADQSLDAAVNFGIVYRHVLNDERKLFG